MIDQLIPPIHVRSVIRTDAVRYILFCVQHLRCTIVLLLGQLVAVGQFHLAIRVRTALGRDQDDTRSGTCTIDRTG